VLAAFGLGPDLGWGLVFLGWGWLESSLHITAEGTAATGSPRSSGTHLRVHHRTSSQKFFSQFSEDGLVSENWSAVSI
jgi:hypothetical protein